MTPVSRLSVRNLLIALLLFAGLCASTAVAAILSGGSTTNISTNVSLSQIALAVPTDAEVGDMLIASVAVLGGAPATISAPQGWAMIARTDNAEEVGLATYWKQYTGTENVYLWTITPQARAVGGIVRYEGVSGDAPIIAATSNSGRGTSATALSVAVENESQVLALYAYDAGITSGNRFSTPIGMVEKFDTSNTPFGPSLSVHDRTQEVSGLSGDDVSDFGNGPQRNWVAQHISLRPQSEVSEDFNSYSDGLLSGLNAGSDWSSAWTGSGVRVQGSVALEGAKSAIATIPGYGEPSARRSFAPKTHGTLYWVQSKDGGGHGHGIKLMSGNTTAFFAQVGSDVGTPGLEWVVTDGAGISVLDPYVVNHIDTADVEFDTVNDQFRISINGGPYSSWKSFQNDVESIDSLELITTSAGFTSVNMYWDDIRIGE